MIAAQLAEWASTLSSVTIASADDGGGSPLLLALGPAGGGAMYFLLWRYYRNTDRSHAFERETRIQATVAGANDTKVDEVKGTKRSRIDGDNRSSHRQRVQRVQ